MNQLAINFAPRFDGATYVHDRDGARLGAQLSAVLEVMQDGQWRTLGVIAALSDAPEASVSARIRDLRKPKFGGYLIEREFVRRGLWRYRMVPADARLSSDSAKTKPAASTAGL